MVLVRLPKTNFFSNLSCIDIIKCGYSSLPGSVFTLLGKFLPSSAPSQIVFQEESTIVLQTAGYIVQMQICLNMTCHKVWSIYIIGRNVLARHQNEDVNR